MATKGSGVDLSAAWQSLVGDLAAEFGAQGQEPEAVKKAIEAVGLDALTAAHFDVQEWHSKLSSQLEVAPKSAQALGGYVTWQHDNFLAAMSALKSEPAITEEWGENDDEDSVPPPSASAFIAGSAEIPSDALLKDPDSSPTVHGAGQFGVTARWALWHAYTKDPRSGREMPKSVAHDCEHDLNTSLCPQVTEAVRRSVLGYAPGFFTALKWSDKGTSDHLEVGAVRQAYHHYHATRWFSRGKYLKKDWGTLNKLASQPDTASIPVPADVKEMSREDCEGVAKQIGSQYSNLGLGYQDAVLLVHGFNNSFDSVMGRVALLARRVPLLHADVGMFSFGSNEAVLKYHGDELRAQAAVRLLATTLQALANNLRKPRATPVKNEETGEEQQQVPLRIHIVAHSLGCRLTFKALEYLKEQGIKLPLGHVVLAAADIGMRDDGAADLEAAARYNCDNITTYFSYSDWPLWYSSIKEHSDLRVGQYAFRFNEDWPFSVNTRCVSSGSGHADVFDSRYARQDLHWVLQHGSLMETPFREEEARESSDCKHPVASEGRSLCKLNCDHVEHLTIRKGETGDCTLEGCDAVGPCAAGFAEEIKATVVGSKYKFHPAILFTEGMLLPDEYVEEAKLPATEAGAGSGAGAGDADRADGPEAQIEAAVKIHKHAAEALRDLLLSGTHGAELVSDEAGGGEKGEGGKGGDEGAGEGEKVEEAAVPSELTAEATRVASVTDEEKKELGEQVARAVAFIGGELAVNDYAESESLTEYEECAALGELAALERASRVLVDELERLFYGHPIFTPTGSSA